jgi:hypothetical protein
MNFKELVQEWQWRELFSKLSCVPSMVKNIFANSGVLL